MLDKEVNELIIDDPKISSNMNAPPSDMDMSDLAGRMSVATSMKKKGERDDMSIM